MNGWRAMSVILAWMVIVVAACGSGPAESESLLGATPVPTSTQVPATSPPVRTPDRTPDEAASPAPADDAEPVDEEASSAGDAEVAGPGRGTARTRDAALRQPAPASGDIRDVDFRNGFYYPMQFDDDASVQVVDGEHESGSFGDATFIGLYVGPVAYGDLDGDFDEEAAVLTSLNGGGSGFFDAVHVYAIEGDRVVLRDTEFFGDRADGGVAHLEIGGGLLRVDAFGTDQGACCPNMVRRHDLALGSHDLTVVESYPTLRWQTIPGYDDVDEVEFVAGTSAAVLDVARFDAESTVWFEAGAGQVVDLGWVRGEVPRDVELFDLDRGEVVQAVSGAADIAVVLPIDGRYEVRFRFDAADREDDTTYLLSITGGGAATIPSWTAQLRQLVVAEDPDVVLTASSPRFDIDDGGLLNGAIQQWLDGETDWWVADVIEYPPLERDDGPELGGEYRLTYSVPFATDELVSVHWVYDEYVCCRPYPNYGQKSLLVDVAAGRIIADGEVLDLGRVDEIHAIWLDEHERQHEYRPDDSYWEGPGWSALTVVAGGVEFGTDRIGAAGASRTFVSWDQLGDLARPAFVGRVADGVTPTGW